MNTAKINRKGNAPELFINDKKVAPIMYGLSDIPGSKSNTAQAQRNIKNFAECGIDIVEADSCLNLGWHKSTDFEIEPIQAEIAGVLEANPDAKVLLRLHMNPPYWWMRDNPDELVLYNGEHCIDDGESYRLIRNDGQHILHVSLASEKWLNEAGELLKRFCEELSATKEGESLIGIQVACGIYGEWHQWGLDTGIPMQKFFVKYLKEKYKTESALRKAWNDKGVTFETAKLSPDPNQTGDLGNFRNPEISQNIIDSQMCLQLSVPKAILHFCKIIKESWNGDILTGSFYGYFVTRGGDMTVIIGHMLPELIFENSQYIDFLCGPFPYLENRLPDGVPMSRALLESMRLNKILWLTEMDQHPVGTENFVGGDPEHRAETISQMQRNILLPVVSGMGAWYYDHRIVPACLDFDKRNLSVGSVFLKKGWWDCPELLKEIEKLQVVSSEYLLRDYEPSADVLVVYDTHTYFYQQGFMDEVYNLQNALGRCGVSYDCIYLSDFKKCDIDRYKLVIFANTFLLNDIEKALIKELIKEKTVVWMYAAGICDKESVNLDFITEVIGIKIKISNSEAAYILTNNERVAFSETRFNPFLSICDNEVERKAIYEKSKECAVGKKDNTWYFATPVVSKSIIEEIINESKAHRYVKTDDFVFAGNGMVVINTYSGGEKNIVLKDGKIITCNLSPLTCAVFDEKTGERKL